MNTTFEPPYLHKTDAMRQIISLVGKGYYYYTKGVVTKEKLLDFLNKMHTNYGVYRTSQQRWRAKAKGDSSTKIICWTKEEKNEVFWMLLATDGGGNIKNKENLTDVRDKKNRLTVTGYELVQLPRPGKEPCWTFRMTQETKQMFYDDIYKAITRRQEKKIRQLVYSLLKAPGFRGVRNDVYAIKDYGDSIWVRVRNKNEPSPFKTFFKGFLGRYKVADREKWSINS